MRLGVWVAQLLCPLNKGTQCLVSDKCVVLKRNQGHPAKIMQQTQQAILNDVRKTKANHLKKG